MFFKRKKKKAKSNQNKARGNSLPNYLNYGIGTDGSITAVPNTASSHTSYYHPYAKGLYTDSTKSSLGSATFENLTKISEENEETLAKFGFKYDESSNKWKLKVTTSVEIGQDEVFSGLLSDKTFNRLMIEKIKILKKDLINKLTSKAVLAELLKPREIKK